MQLCSRDIGLYPGAFSGSQFLYFYNWKNVSGSKRGRLTQSWKRVSECVRTSRTRELEADGWQLSRWRNTDQVVLGYPLTRGRVRVKVGMLSTDQPRGQKFTLLSHDLLKPWDVTGDGTPREPQGVQSGGHRGSSSLAWGLAQQALSWLGVLPSVLCGVLSIPWLSPAW